MFRLFVQYYYIITNCNPTFCNFVSFFYWYSAFAAPCFLKGSIRSIWRAAWKNGSVWTFHDLEFWSDLTDFNFIFRRECWSGGTKKFALRYLVPWFSIDLKPNQIILLLLSLNISDECWILYFLLTNGHLDHEHLIFDI